MVKREIITIDEDKCNGCGLCIPNCPEGALQVIDGKARLISDLFCDGLGACVGHCPQGAITVEKREAKSYDEKKVMENIIKAGPNVIKAHLMHLKDHGETGYLKEALNVLEKKKIKNPLDEEEKVGGMHVHEHKGCPGVKMMDLRTKTKSTNNELVGEQNSELKQWPIQLHLVPPMAPYFKNADLLIVADCVGFANPNLQQKMLKGKAIVIGCPKLDDTDAYKEKIKAIIEMNDLNTITVAIMEVPCCGGLYDLVEEALDETKKRITLKKIVVGIDGEIRN